MKNKSKEYTLQKIPIPVNIEMSADFRWKRKPVEKSRLIDDMEDASTWLHRGYGQLLFTKERFRTGTQSLRLISPTKSEKPGPEPGRPFGEACALRSFNKENWNKYNRLSFWVYPHLPGFKIISLLIKLYNSGYKKVPDEYEREGLNFVILEGFKWNHVVWEIPHLARDKVDGVEFVYRLQGNEPEATDIVIFDFDQLELQNVKADHYEGWNLPYGKIAFSHTGYQTGTTKKAITRNSLLKKFRLINADNGKIVLEKPVQIMKAFSGEFQLLDFSEVITPGNYHIHAGDYVSPVFQIDHNVWQRTIWKSINFFFCERCGTRVPGIHNTCHQDWQAVHHNKRIIINGGWHDAGDLSQGLINTSEAVYSMFSLAERLKHDDPVLSKRLIDEAQWGLKWVLKTRFGDGYRVIWATIDFWTDGIMGTADDTPVKVHNYAPGNFLSASAEAIAHRALFELDPALAAHCLKIAKEDWQSGMEKLNHPGVELASAGSLASIELYKCSGDEIYITRAIELAEVIINSQQQDYTDWDIPLTGFFYTDSKKEHILHYFHRGHEQAPIVALAGLCTLLPNHSQWIKWYTAVTLYSEYLKTISEFTKPYYMLPNGIYRIDESRESKYKNQVLKGIKLDKNHYLRRFPVWFVYRGNYGTLLSQAKALSTAAHLRRNLELLDVCRKQLEWIVGRNPFTQSTMYGEGYDYAPQYSAMSGNIAGSLPVGIQTREDEDTPYWPASNCYNYKEVWVHPVSRWLWIMCDLEGQAVLRGSMEEEKHYPVIYNIRTGNKIEMNSCKNGLKFETRLDEGKYRIKYADKEKTLTLLPGEIYQIDLNRMIDFKLYQNTMKGGYVKIKLTAKGSGKTNFKILSTNIEFEDNQKEINLSRAKNKEITWTGRIISKKKPWVTVVIPDGDYCSRQEISSFSKE